ncbi:MAG TPA: response regulator transcription factor [Acidimicrobiales bacterium]
MSGEEARGVEVVCVPDVDAAVERAIRLAGLKATPEREAGRLVERLAHATGEIAAVLLDASSGSVADTMAVCRTLRRLDVPFEPIVLVVERAQLDDLALRDELFDDFVVTPVVPDELAARLRHLLAVRGTTTGTAVLERGGLSINLETYQASVAGRALDLTYMEYELLRFLAANPTRVFTRETLLSRVWGYEYYGGARTVDVHVRRLRAKLGEEHAHLIQTVRSVGYRFG